MGALDLDKFAAIAALFGSDKAGERENALAIANRQLDAAGMHWRDIVEASKRAALTDEAAKIAIAEANQLRARVAELEHQQPDWQPLQIPIGQASRTAEWTLDLHRRGRIWVSPWEVEFLAGMSGWHGLPTSKQRVRLQIVVDRIRQCTGLTPPP